MLTPVPQSLQLKLRTSDGSACRVREASRARSAASRAVCLAVGFVGCASPFSAACSSRQRAVEEQRAAGMRGVEWQLT